MTTAITDIVDARCNLSKKLVLMITLTAFTTLAQAELTDKLQADDLQANEQQAVSLVQQFASQLKPRLKTALTKGGPVHAIEVCAKEAPDIAAQLSKENGWTIKRVSARNRNPDATPDAWETETIDIFKTRLAAGETPSSLTRTAVTAVGFRFAKAQIAEPLCLVCHGQTISANVTEALAKYYPEDRATGYEAGQLRGIFSLHKPLLDGVESTQSQ